MNFNEAFTKMKEGYKIKMPDWGGYWCWENGTIMIHTKEGEILDLFNTNMKEMTLGYIASNDWEIAADSNTPILGGTAQMDFGKALEQLKKGIPMTRLGWNGKGLKVVYQKAYPEGIPCNKQTAEAWGMNEGDLFKCQPYLQISTVQGSHAMWVPSITDIFATDWTFA